MDAIFVIGAYVLGGGFLLLLGLIFYWRAVISRRRYHCPACGEQLEVELMDAHHCNMCGAPLKEKEDYYA